MKTVVAGSRTITNRRALDWAMGLFVHRHGMPTEVVSGCASGVDAMGQEWAAKHGVPVKRYPVSAADWERLGKRAGPLRNAEMAEYADALVLLWDGRSRGSKDMLHAARARNLVVVNVAMAMAVRA